MIFSMYLTDSFKSTSKCSRVSAELISFKSRSQIKCLMKLGKMSAIPMNSLGLKCIIFSSLFLISTQFIPKFSCQTQDEQTVTSRSISTTRCNQEHQSDQSAQVDQLNLAKLQVSPKSINHRVNQHQSFARRSNNQFKQHRMLENVQFHDERRPQLLNGAKLNLATTRQQRQFSNQQATPMKSANLMMSGPSNQQLAITEQGNSLVGSQQSQSQPQQPEEFSLGTQSGQQSAIGAAPSGGIPGEQLMASASQTVNSVVLAPPEGQNLTRNGYSMIGPELASSNLSDQVKLPAIATTVTNEPGAVQTTTISSDLQASADNKLSPPTETHLANTAAPISTEQLQSASTLTPSEMVGETLSAPSIQQATPTTTTSLSLTPSGKPSVQPQQQQQQQQQQALGQSATRQQGRRMEESSTSAVERHSSSLALEQHPTNDQQQHQLRHAISSAPSSMSIITPLIGAPTQPTTTTTNQVHFGPAEQQQSPSTSSSSTSSMVKPIYVVGNPIGELDYTSTTFDQGKTRPALSSQPRLEKKIEDQQQAAYQQHQLEQVMPATVLNATGNSNQAESHGQDLSGGDRMNGPALVYSGGQLVGVDRQESLIDTNSSQHQPAQAANSLDQTSSQHVASVAPPSARLFQANGGNSLGTSLAANNGAVVLGNSPRRPSLPPAVNQANAASGFRSPLSPSGPLIGQPATPSNQNANVVSNQAPIANSMIQQPANSLMMSGAGLPNFYQTLPPYAGASNNQMYSANSQVQQQQQQQQQVASAMNQKQAFVLGAQSLASQFQLLQQQSQPQQSVQLPPQASITSHQKQQQQQQQQQQQGQIVVGGAPNGTNYQSRRPLNITRVEHISAECSNDLIRAVIVFNGTFKGIIYSSGYVNDPTCLYVNGTGLTRYEFNIRLNQCGTLGRQELHQPTIPGEARRRDQVMWNTLSIQYNPVIEQEWDEHFRVSCEYGSDFWKTISFSPFNVETNTGSPVVFTINPPQCQMDVLLGHGMGPKIAVDGPVTVGDPLTLLIHMKSEKAGYDILVKNCIAHNGGKQRMQLIDSNGCVVNERFISPFRGTYNDNDLRHVTLYAYLKAFRFTGSPVLYLECEIHMCQSACPPQMCYWRRLSKRSVDNSDFEYTPNSTYANATETPEPVISDSLSLFKALQVRHEPIEPARARQRAQALKEIYAEDDEAQLVCYRHAEVLVFLTTLGLLFLLILSISIACCLRIRKLTRSHRKQFQHNRLATNGSLSPSLLSIGDAFSSAGSMIGTNSVLSFNSIDNHGSQLTGSKKVWQQQQQIMGQHHKQQHQRNNFNEHHRQQHSPNSYATCER